MRAQHDSALPPWRLCLRDRNESRLPWLSLILWRIHAIDEDEGDQAVIVLVEHAAFPVDGLLNHIAKVVRPWSICKDGDYLVAEKGLLSFRTTTNGLKGFG